MSKYRPQGKLARVIYQKFHNDRILDEYDPQLWYKLNGNLPYAFQSKFLPLNQPDEVTLLWLERTKILSANIWLHLWHAIVRTFLQFFMTQTDINGLLKRGSMFILSALQFKDLLTFSGFNVSSSNTVQVLDIGAGDGKVTECLYNSVKNYSSGLNVCMHATETSWIMRKRLRKLHFNIIDNITDVQNIDLISCLNVLDRCVDPVKMLHDIYSILAPNGRVILALVLPYFHYVELNKSHLPVRPLMKHWPEKSKQYSFEEETTIFFELLETLGFEVEAWTKAPYLCEGDIHQSFYWLLDVVVVLSKKPNLQ